MRRLLFCLVVLAACGDNAAGPACFSPPEPFAVGSPDGHPDPLGASATEARAGRIHASQLPMVSSGLVTWADNDFVLANDKVALVIEDVGDSDLYDPWGGRPVGVARMANGALIEPANFGEFFILTGRSTVVTDSVTVMNDGSDGKPAVIRARGKLHPLPFFESVIAVVYADDLTDIDAAIDYTLAPGSEHVDITMHYASPRGEDTVEASTIHALMYTARMPAFQPGLGFDTQLANAPYIALVDDDATSWGYIPAQRPDGQRARRSRASSARSRPASRSRVRLDRAHARAARDRWPRPRRHRRRGRAHAGRHAARDHRHRHARRCRRHRACASTRSMSPAWTRT